LLAEDNLPDAFLVREAIKLQNLPLEVHLAADGEGAIAFIQNAGKDVAAPVPDVVLLDLNLPKIDGFEVLRTIRASEEFRDLPVIVITSSDSPEDRSRTAALGAEYFRKVPNYAEFLKIGKTLREVLVRRGLLEPVS
jgi:two-component system, chemotaxis family, response regulator Rcp1